MIANNRTYENQEKQMEKSFKEFWNIQCKLCLHQKDSHEMNCIECCPLDRAVKNYLIKIKRLEK